MRRKASFVPVLFLLAGMAGMLPVQAKPVEGITAQTRILGDVSPRGEKQAEPEKKKPKKRGLVVGNRGLARRGCGSCRSETDNPVDRGLRYLALHQTAGGLWENRMAECACPVSLPRVDSIPIPTVPPGLQKKTSGLVDRFDENSIEIRDKAEKDLLLVGKGAIPELVRGVRQGDPETRARCERLLQRIWAPSGMSEIELTGFALLAFSGSGYSHLNKESVGKSTAGEIVKKGLKALMVRQDEKGRIGRGKNSEHLVATLALCETYRNTGSTLIKPMAKKALMALETLQLTTPRDLTWRCFIIRSASKTDLPATKTWIGEAKKQLEGKGGPWVPVARFLLQGLEGTKSRFQLSLPEQGVSTMHPELLFLNMLLVREFAPELNKMWGNLMKPIRQGQKSRTCSLGSWDGVSGHGRMQTTIFRVLSLLVYYRYANTLP